MRAAYIKKLIAGPIDAIVRAYSNAVPASLETGAAVQETPVSFNRRFVTRDGSVRTWMTLDHPDVIRSAGPIDPEIGLLLVRPKSPPADPTDRQNKSPAPTGVLSNFALHLDTVGGTKWSADYPYFIEQSLRQELGHDVISVFGTGCCGDINHSDPRRRERNKTDFIGRSIADSIRRQLARLRPMDSTELFVESRAVQLPLQNATATEVDNAIKIMQAASHKEKVEFLDHVTAYKKLVLDQFRNKEPHAKTAEHITWGLSRSLAGVGAMLPTEVTVLAIGRDIAIVCLPGEVFVELGLAIKQASPFRTTMIIELSNCVETIYVPHRAAYVGGSYEVTNSALQPGGGELLVEAALGLLRDAASSIDANRPSPK